MPLARNAARLLAPLAAAALVALGGCADALRRSDFVTDRTGDATAANKAIHVVDPWPRESFDTRLPTDAGRVAGPAGRYRAGETAAPAAKASGGYSPAASAGGSTQ